MPSITTHHIFAEEVYKGLSSKIKDCFNEEFNIYTTFAQSHDYLFYYSFDFKNARKIKDLGHYAHHNKTQDYLVNIIKEIKNKHLENNKQCVAYLFGVITHYVLDTTTHPFIFYKTGVYRKNDKRTYIFQGEHNRMEKDLDAIYYMRYHKKKYNHCKLNKEIIQKPVFSKNLKSLIDYVYKETYDADNIGMYYYKGIKHAKIINCLVIQDFFGIKKALYKFIDFVFRKRFGNLAAYSNFRPKPDISLLNEEHIEWNHPSIKDKHYTYSFNDLFNLSIKKAINIINEVYKVLYEDKEIDLILPIIPDIDYSTGLKIESNIRMDHFERDINNI